MQQDGKRGAQGRLVSPKTGATSESPMDIVGSSAFHFLHWKVKQRPQAFIERQKLMRRIAIVERRNPKKELPLKDPSAIVGIGEVPCHATQA
jgi:hypothetical protein